MVTCSGNNHGGNNNGNNHTHKTHWPILYYNNDDNNDDNDNNKELDFILFKKILIYFGLKLFCGICATIRIPQVVSGLHYAVFFSFHISVYAVVYHRVCLSS